MKTVLNSMIPQFSTIFQKKTPDLARLFKKKPAAKTSMPMYSDPRSTQSGLHMTDYIFALFIHEKCHTTVGAKKKLCREENTSDASLNSVFLKNNNFEF